MSLFWAHIPVFKDSSGNKIPNSIAEIEMLTIGKNKQFVVIRGEDISKPVLLLLHGGPGSPETGLFRYYNHHLEKEFVVVNWDRRACGKSYTRESAEESLSVDMFVEDVCELTQYLRDYLKKEKIFLLGHSWGTAIGTMAAYRNPELFYAYVGTGQVSSMPAGELESYRFVLKTAKESGNKEAVKELEETGEPENGVYKCGTLGTKTERKWLTYFVGAIYGKRSFGRFLKKLLFTKEYNVIDLYHFLKGMNAPARNKMSQEEFLKINLFEIVKELKIPVYFFLGRHDYQVPSILAEEYFNYLKAPKKTLEWFEESAHCPCFEESSKFNKLMIERVLKENIT